MTNPKIVVLCLENRAFDGYFGTRQDAKGFYDPDAVPGVFSQQHFSEATTVSPFRASTFSTIGECLGEYGVFWPYQNAAWNYGAVNGWSISDQKQPSNTTPPLLDGSTFAGSMAYWAPNDIPYRWSLAQNFLLCDTYFSSVRGSTFPNRMFMMSGTVFSPESIEQVNSSDSPTITWQLPSDNLNLPVLDNLNPPEYTYPWQTYPATIGTSAPWTLYDETEWVPEWAAWNNPAPPEPALPAFPQLPAYLAFYGTSGPHPPSDAKLPFWAPNIMAAQASSVANYQLGTAADPDNTPFVITNASGQEHTGYYYTPTPSAGVSVDSAESNFMRDALAGNLPDISWILPPYWLSDHPSYLSVDADAYVCRVVDAVVRSPHWTNEGIVLIITYDEANGSFDHVCPPSPLSDQLAAYGSGGAIPSNPTPISSSGLSATPAPVKPTDEYWEPWASGSVEGLEATASVGAGFRVATVVVSPWTFQAGVSSQTQPDSVFDHSSIIQYLEDLGYPPCPNLPPLVDGSEQPNYLAWRRHTFASLGELIPGGSAGADPDTVLGALPTPDQVDAWRLDALTRLFGLTPADTSEVPPVANGLTLAGPNPLQATPPQQFPPIQQQCYLIMGGKSSFGSDEVEAMSLAQHGARTGEPVTFKSAFWIIVDGFDPAEVDLGDHVPVDPSAPSQAGHPPKLLAGAIAHQVTASLSLNGSPLPSISVAGQQVPPVKIVVHAVAEPDNPAPLADVPQRFRFPCDIVFPAGSAAFGPAGLNVTPAAAVTFDVQAQFSSRLTFQAPIEQIELVATADPYIQNGSTLVESNDLRVFKVHANGTDRLVGAPYVLDVGDPDPVKLLRDTLSWLNAHRSAWPSAPSDPYASSALPWEESVSEVTVFPTEDGVTVCNFAIVRVTLQGVSDPATNLRVFFRLFPAQATNTMYEPASLYRSTPSSAAGPNPAGAAVDTQPNPEHPTWTPTRVPLLGIGTVQPITGSDVASIPFFAVPRIDATVTSMSEQAPDLPNVQQITPDSDGEPVYAFFGCWLDINVEASDPGTDAWMGPTVNGYAQTARYPRSIPASSTQPDGPYASASYDVQSIKAFAQSQHQCIVAEVVYDPLPPIPFGTIPGDSGQLVQRNLTVDGGVNG